MLVGIICDADAVHIKLGTGTIICDLYVQEQDLRQVFEPFGAVDYITLQKDLSGRSQGYGFVQ